MKHIKHNVGTIILVADGVIIFFRIKNELIL